MTTSAYALIAANLIPLLMSAVGGWGIREILPLYWFESAIIGVFNVLKIIAARGPIRKLTVIRGRGGDYVEQDKTPGGPYSGAVLGAKLFLVFFFTFHFGMFMLVHGVFLFGLVLGGGNTEGANTDWLRVMLSVKWGVAALFCGHAVSFALNYIRGGEYLTAQPYDCMMQPYSRIVIMHLTIMLGGFLTLVVKTPGPAMFFFVVLKIFADVKAHLKEHSARLKEGNDIVILLSAWLRP